MIEVQNLTHTWKKPFYHLFIELLNDIFNLQIS